MFIWVEMIVVAHAGINTVSPEDAELIAAWISEAEHEAAKTVEEGNACGVAVVDVDCADVLFDASNEATEYVNEEGVNEGVTFVSV
jgi:hypothetical protein